MAAPNNPKANQELEDLVYETRFLLNVLVEVLVKKNIFSEKEFTETYHTILNEEEKKKS